MQVESDTEKSSQKIPPASETMTMETPVIGRSVRARVGAAGIAGLLATWACVADAAIIVRPGFRLAPEVGYAVHADGFGEPRGVLLSSAGDLYVADARRNEVVQITREGRRTVVARDVRGANHLAIDPLGFLYVAALARNEVLKVSPQGVVTVFLAGLAGPVKLGFNLYQDLLVCEVESNTIRSFSSPRQSRVVARVERPFGLAFTRDGVTLAVENGSGRILRLLPDGRSERFVGGLQEPEGIALGPSGDLFVAEPRAGRLSRFRPDGTRQTVAEGLLGPRDSAFDAYGQLFVPEAGTGRILRFTGDF